MELLETKTLYSGWGRFLMLTVRTAGGATVQRQLEDHGPAAVVLPYDPERKVAMIARLARVGPLFLGEDPFLPEAAAGMIDVGETPQQAILREALEEVGLELGALEPVGALFTTPTVSSEVLHLYLAPYGEADRVGAGGGLAGEHEEIEALETPLAELARQADAGVLRDLKTFALVQTLRLKRPDLFA